MEKFPAGGAGSTLRFMGHLCAVLRAVYADGKNTISEIVARAIHAGWAPGMSIQENITDFDLIQAVFGDAASVCSLKITEIKEGVNMSKLFSSAALTGIFVLFSIAVPVHAEGFYVSGELGMNFGESLDTDGHDTDRASVCDEYINPSFNMVNQTPGWEDTNCTGPNRGSDSVWENKFGSDEGVLFGAALGYHIRDSRFRAELEYFYRDTGYEEASEVIVGGGEVLSKTVQEIVRAEERIGDVSSHNLFANLYIDFASDSRFTPYIGFGIGFGFTEMEYDGAFARDIDPANITTGNAPDGGQALPNAGQIQQNLAGTTTTESNKLDDTLFGYQFIVGVDYALNEALSLGVKGRWVSFDSFKDDDEWDQLRSHPSNLRKNGEETVVYDIKVDDIEMFGVSLNLKYKF